MPVPDPRQLLPRALRTLTQDVQEWPLRDRRRFRNLLLDAVSSDSLPLVELLLRVHDDGLLRALPDRTAARAAWDSAAARLTSELQSRLFVEPVTARWLADTWVHALGPELVPVARPAPPPAPPPARSPTPARASATPRPATSTAPSRQTTATAASSAASLAAYQRSNRYIVAAGVVLTVLIILMFRSTATRRDAPRAELDAPIAAAEPASDSTPARDTAAQRSGADSTAALARADSAARVPGVTPGSAVPRADGAPPAPAGDSVTASDSATPAPSAIRVDIGPRASRTTDDIVLKAGRVFEAQVMGIRHTSVLVKDSETQLDFEIPKADIDKIVTRDGRVMRFGDDNVPLLGNERDVATAAFSGRYRLRYAERWGAQVDECRNIGAEFAPGSSMIVRHLRGAPMLKIEFVGGQGLNASVRADGLFESVAVTAPRRTATGAFVQYRLSGRFSRNSRIDGVLRLQAITPDGAMRCDVALTLTGTVER